MKVKNYLSFSVATHIFLAIVFFLVWPRFSPTTRFEIVLQPAISNVGSRKSETEQPADSSYKTPFLSRSRLESGPVSIPKVPLPSIAVPSNLPLDDSAYLPSLDDLVLSNEPPVRIFTPELDDWLAPRASSSTTTTSASEIVWLEGEEFLSNSLNEFGLSQIQLKNQLSIQVELRVEESGIVSNIQRTLTGDQEIDQKIDRFLGQMSFRPSTSSYNVRFILKLIPGAIFR